MPRARTSSHSLSVLLTVAVAFSVSEVCAFENSVVVESNQLLPSDTTGLSLASPPCNPGFAIIDTVGNLYGGNRALALADFDGDGDLDVAGGLVLLDGVSHLSWWENRLPSEFIHHEIDTVGVWSLAAGDLDGDGDVDLVGGREPVPGLLWFENTGTGEFVRRVADSSSRAACYSISAIDLDGDTDLDILTTTPRNNPDSLNYDWSAFENDGSGVFTEHPVPALGYPFIYPQPLVIAAGDLDGDGDADVLMPGDTLGPILWWENLGGMVFRQDSLPQAMDVIVSATIGDLDSDHDNDVIAFDFAAGGQLWWWENTGSLGFTAHQIASQTYPGTWIALADLNGDGSVDLATSNPFAWWENDGTESFSRHSLNGSFSGQGGIILPGDLDRDCRTDLVGSDWDGRAIVWWRNDCVALCPCHADPQCDSVISDVQDVVVTVNVAFRGQTPTGDPDCIGDRTDVNCSGSTDVVDVVRVINVAFRGGSIASEYCDPCP